MSWYEMFPELSKLSHKPEEICDKCGELMTDELYHDSNRSLSLCRYPIPKKHHSLFSYFFGGFFLIMGIFIMLFAILIFIFSWQIAVVFAAVPLAGVIFHKLTTRGR